MENNFKTQITDFLQAPAFAVVGASNNRDKYGNKVLRSYMQHKKVVYPVNAHEQRIEGLACITELNDLPNTVASISVVTPPLITEKIVAQAIKKGIKNIWLQPGTDSPTAVAMCKQHNLNIIFGGPCILVVLGFKDLST